MVMEGSVPSPQNVGREFVRQYYTLLNKAPTHLHRFYNNSSVFIHGGLDTTTRDPSPAIGQRQIHQRIQQLNFQDCHAKINQVDSQATLGDGVVVQVSGELSNAGQAMRRFTQTFVLAAQSPKQYYVHNDIFRYQDFGYPDEDEDEGIEGVNDGGERETEEAVRSENEDELQQNQTQEHASERHSQAPLITPQQAPLPQQPMYYSLQQQNVHQVMGAVTINGSVHEDTPLMPQQPPQTQPQPTQQHSYIEPTTQEQFSQENEIDSTNDQVQQPKEELQAANEESSDQQEGSNFSTSHSETNQTITTATNINSGPKTYANLVKSSPSSAANVVSPQSQKMSASPPPMSNLRLAEERMPIHSQSNASSLSMAGANSTQQPNRLGGTQHSQNQYQSTIRPTRPGPMQRDGDRRSGGGRPGSYHDSHQLFLGNLPHNASDNELRQLFERYGRVAELRVHSKANERGKGPQQSNSQGKVPNYGFITFEDSSVVSKILNGPPIHFPDEHGQKLNIEIKKPKGGGRGPMDGASRSSLGDMRPMGPQQQQRGPGSFSSDHSSVFLGGPGNMMRGGSGARGMRSSFSRGNEGGRGGGGMRQPGNPANSNYPNRR